MTKIYKDIVSWQNLTESSAYKNKKIGFVPTMGALHQGHATLFGKSKSENQITVASIFVNPTQFNNASDLREYPNKIEEDLELLNKLEVDFCLLPSVEQMYPDNYQFSLEEKNFSKILCGKFRPGHFSGVLTVVLKLFNLVKPTNAYFGEKDYQQFLLIKEMVSALFLPINVVGCPTVREVDGLAMSSRNLRLSEAQRKKATIFAGELKSKKSCSEIMESLEKNGFKVDYIEEIFGRRFGAATIGEVRLIDNVSL